MDLYELVDHIAALVQQRGQVTYRSLKRQFSLDDAYFDDLKAELLYAHPLSLAQALVVTLVHHYRREWDQVLEQADAGLAIATEHGFPFFIALSTIFRGRAVVEYGRATDGIAQIRWGIAALRATGTEATQSYFLALLAEAYLHDGQIEEGLATVAEALAFVERTEERFHEAEVWRIKGELLLAQAH